ncbi:Calpain family cysteine protease/Calpain large subunit, domain III, putative [Angomonas deanei]|uniref:Calpain family cysteine protease/Calpain large subunit, domain III, putative n=2 Tax=Angomonas deanei TaxID=59799 RepID=A0A7G2C9F2_9TRYP|nr:Calpain family cysteine protease/Calpain large subunit, domain III, putative [Angomonas deanei]
MSTFKEPEDSKQVFLDAEFHKKNEELADEWISIAQLYPKGKSQPLLPDTFSREQFSQGYHYECFMLSALSTLVRFPDVIRHCFVTKKVRQDGRYTFQFFRGKQWVKVEIDDRIAQVGGDTLYCQSPTEHWWPLLLEKAYAKFYTGYDHLEGCTLQETFHDLTGLPVLNIPMDVKLAKAANCMVSEGAFWLEVSRKITAGECVASALTKGSGFDEMGIQTEQQYGILEIFSLTGSSQIDDIVIHLFNPFEDEVYTGPLNPNDSIWTPKLKAKYDVTDSRSIFLPLVTFLKIINSMQVAFLPPIILNEATYFDDAWKGETAGGNPTSSLWRKNPLYYVSNLGHEAVTFSFVIKQDDQRHLFGPEVDPTYKQCGMVLTQYTYPRPIPTKWVTGNNHKAIHKSLFLNSREVSNSVSIPPNSLCYLVPSCMDRGVEAQFTLAVYRMSNEDYSSITLRKLDLPEMNWEAPITVSVELQMRTKDRIDFYVDSETDVHILLHQKKPYKSPKTGGDAMAQDFMGMYLYNDMDRKISGVHAATNYRETSIIHHLPNSGRYAISVTCPRGSGDVPAEVTIVTSKKCKARQVDTPADAAALPDEDEDVEEGEGHQKKAARIDYDPINLPASKVTEVPDSNVPFEDKKFLLDNKDITSDPWVHISDLYPEGKDKPLLPPQLSCEQFSQGEHYECCCLSAFATLVQHHPDVIQNVFVSKKPRRDGRYTFQFNRYGQWVKVEIDDRIPMLGDKTYFCRSPTHHWWPLLLEKAYAKFYTLYQNLEGCTLQEIYHDFTGCAVVSIPLNRDLAKSAGHAIDNPQYWIALNEALKTTAIAGLSLTGRSEQLGLNEDQGYGVLEFISESKNPSSLSDIIVKLHNPFVDSVYTGPMSKSDRRWTQGLLKLCTPERQNEIYMPVDLFCQTFLNMHQAHLKDVVEPSWHFNSEWGEDTNGGNPTMVSWRENPLYVVKNTSKEPTEIIAMIRQPDQRHILHTLPDHEPNYIQCGLVLSQSIENNSIPTYLVTGNSHQMVHKGLFVNAREVANTVLIPPSSLCYLVPSAMHHEMGIFLLSYWYKKKQDQSAVSIRRLTVQVARKLPAVAHVTLEPKGKDRVDFIIDQPSEAHILLSQLKPSKVPGVSDAMTEDFLGMYIYDEKDDRIAGVVAATNFRETGLVAALPKAGRYALSITCPRAEGSVPCRVEIVCSESAHVRITDTPEDAPEFFESSEVRDAEVKFDNDRYVTLPEATNLEAVHERASEAAHYTPAGQTPATEAEPTLTHEDLVAQSFLKEEYLGIPVKDIPVENNDEFVQKAAERAQLLKDPVKNASKIQSLETGMHRIAEEMAKQMHDDERRFLDSEPEGVPIELLPLNEDVQFSELEDKLRKAIKDSAKAQVIKDLQEKLNARAHELASDLKNEERLLFLNPMPLGVPYQELNLDNDPEFHEKEIERLKLRQQDPEDTRAISKLNAALNKRAEELARKKLSDGREAYLDPEHLHVANRELPLDDNESFVRLEAHRQDLVKDPSKNRAAIAKTEQDLNDMAKEMAKEFLAEQRPGYLGGEFHGNAFSALPLNDDDDFLAKERERRDLLSDPTPANKERAKEIEEDLNEAAQQKGKQVNADDRSSYMKPTYYGIRREDLPLDTDERFDELESKRAHLKQDPSRNKNAIQSVEKSLNDRAAELAKKSAMNRDYLDPFPEGVPVELLPLDTDPVFQNLESQRADILGMSNPDIRALAAVEDKLNERAHELAKQYKDNLRPKYTKNLPISPGELSLDSDAPFVEMERKMMALIQEDPVKHREQIRDLQEALMKRATELAKQRESDTRAIIPSEILGIPRDELGLDNDAEFKELEQELRDAKKNNADEAAIAAIEGKLQARAEQLAEEELVRRIPQLEKAPCGIPLSSIKGLQNNQEINAMMEELGNERKSPKVQTAKAKDLQQKLNDRITALASEQLEEERNEILGEDIVEEVGSEALNNDPEFAALEAKWHELMKDPVKNADAIAAIEEQMRERARELAEEQKWKDREEYLNANPEGIPLRELGLDEDPKFLAMEEERRELLKDPVRNAGKIAALEKDMNDYVEELAKQKKADALDGILGKDRDLASAGVDPEVLMNDPEFAALEAEWRELMKDPKKNADAIAAIEEQMRERARELAEEQKWKDRADLLGENPEGVPLSALGLDEDPKFLAMEEERRELLKDPVRNAGKIAALEKDMNDYVHELAKEKLKKDREMFLDDKYGGIDRDDIKLDEDEEFKRMETERARLKNLAAKQLAVKEEHLRNAERVSENETGELVRDFPGQDWDLVLDNYPREVDECFKKGVADALNIPQSSVVVVKTSIASLHVVYKIRNPDEDEREINRKVGKHGFPELMALYKARLQSGQQQAPTVQEQIDTLEAQMRERARELAEAQKWKDREEYLDTNPEGIPLRELGLDEDPKFLAMEEERRELLKDPVRNAGKIAALEKDMNDYVHELAKEKKADELNAIINRDRGLTSPLVDADVLNNDPEFISLEAQRRELMKDPVKNARAIAAIEEKMRERARELAEEQKWKDREEYLDANPEGIPLRELGLDEDPKFLAMEEERRELLKDPVRNAGKIAALEKDMNDYVHELAKQKLADDRKDFLPSVISGIAREDVNLNDDSEFRAMENERARLIAEDPVRNARKIKDLESKLRDRAQELAEAQKWKDREEYLDANPEGIPLRELGLDEDPKFLAMEEERRELLKDPVRNAGKIAALEKDMNDYVHELAKQKKADELGGIMSKDRGLASAPVDAEVLMNDPEFAALEAEWRELMKDPKKNARAIAAIEEKMRERARELAEEEKWKDREEYLDANPEGVPLRELGLDEDPKFLAMEEERRELLKDPVRNAGKIAALEKDMNDYVHELAKQKLADDRKDFLPSVISGIAREDVNLNDDSEFRAMENERARLIAEDPVRNARKIKDLESKLRDRAQELAEAQKWKDREEYLDANPEGIPLRELGLDEDPKFLEMEEERRELLKDPVRNAGKIAALEKDMNDYVHELAKQKKADELGGIMSKDRGLASAPVDAEVLMNDPEFAALEAEWRELMKDPKKNARAIAAIEEKMRERARELAEEEKWKDREEYLDANPEGVPLRELGLDEDPKFLAMEEERRELLKDPVRNAGKIAALEKDMNDYVHELAKQKLADDRKDFLPSVISGIAREDVNLNDDSEFRAMENERARLIAEDPVRNARKIKDLESKLRDRAQELAEAQKWKDREEYLDANPEGIPLRELGLDEDPKFLDMEEERRELLKDPVRNAGKIAALEKDMNDYVHELAKQKKADELGGIMSKDRGLASAPVDAEVLMNDPEFAALEAEWRELMKDPKKNARAIAAIEEKMRERARELAEEQKWKDREEYLDANPEGVPLRELGLDEDPKFLEMEERRRELLKDPVRNADKIAALEKDMNDYVTQKAKKFNEEEREELLGLSDGIDVGLLNLSGDPEFVAYEQERHALVKADAVANRRRISNLEQKMRDRARELAEEQKWKDREEYLDANPEGVPLRELGLDEDPKFLEMEERRRELLKDPVRNAGKIAALEKDMNDYVHELAKQKLADDRKDFLPSVISGIAREDVNLNDDSEFRAMENERARLIAEDPVRNARKIKDLESKLRDRAQELAEAQKWKDREEYLDANPEGVPLRELGLDEDPKFLAMEEERRELLKDPVRNAGKIAALEKDMNDYVHELAKQKKADELGGIMSKDRGLASAPVDPEVLLNDPEFASLEAKWRELMKDPKKNAREIAAIEEKMRERARELAEEEKWKDREEYLDANPEGVPLRELGLDEDPKFLEMEERRRELLKDPVRNAGKIAALEKDMNDYVHELAKEKLKKDREMFLDDKYGGIDRDDIKLDEDEEFKRMETERARLKDLAAKQLAVKEEHLRNAERVSENETGELVRDFPGQDWDLVLDNYPREVDECFKKGVADALNIPQSSVVVVKTSIASLHVVYKIRNPKDSEGEINRKVGKHGFPELMALYKARHKSGLQQAPTVQEQIDTLEAQMRERARELAEEQKWKDREEYLDANPEGVPLRELGLDEDPKFLEMEERRRELLKDPVRNAGKIAALEKDMNDYVHELAKQKLADDRKNFLPSHISGVPLEDIPLDDDSLFRDMERERARLIAEDPVRNARKIQDLEKKMNARAQELAEAQKWKDREEYLDANPEGVPLRELGLDEDPKFLEMEERRRELLKDPVRNAGKIAALEKDMNDYVHELAKQKKADELGGIMSKDRGLASAPVDPEVLLNDPEFASLEAKWRELMKDPKKNAREIAAIEEKMRERARELAEEEKWKDREEYLDANPEGVPLRELGLDEDPKFLEMEERRRELLKDPVRNAGKIAALEKDMNDYVHELAKQKLADDRKNFLPSHISGVPLEDIPLDDDSLFRDMERERARLIAEDPVRNARKIQDLEKKMNARAQELAEAQKWKDREEYLDANPEGVPLRELGLDEDPKFLEMEERRRELLKDPVRNAGKIAALEKDMNDYVHELAKQKLADDRKNFLPSHISGVPLEDIPLDDDSLFRDMERERARLIAEDPVRNARKIQ